jgi:hypothetical protein
MNRDVYDQAWAALLGARRGSGLPAIIRCAEKLAYEARELERRMSQGEPCDHFLTLNGYCVDCGFNLLFDKDIDRTAGS